MERGGQGDCSNNGGKLVGPCVASVSVYILAPSSELALWQKMKDKEHAFPHDVLKWGTLVWN